MDWFDQYLDGMGDYKVTVSPADTHQWGPAKPSRQQQSLMQDAMAFDVQQMRIIQEAREQLERHGGAPDPGSAPLAPASVPAPAFPASITLTGDFGFINAAPPVLFPITDLSQLDAFQEISALAGVYSSTITTPYRVYLSSAPNASNGYDYIYMIYLLNNTGGYYNEFLSPGRWFIGNGYSYSGDNEGYYSNYGYYTALQSKSTPPSTNIANWTRIPGSYPNSGSITGISFAY